MSRYQYRCTVCGEESEIDAPIGTASRTRRCDCGRPARLVLGQGVYIAAAARPNSGAQVVSIDQRDRRFDKDGPAYKRMRNRGLQPQHIDGCARLENEVGTQTEIDYARAIKVANLSGGGGTERVLEVASSIEQTHG